MTIFVIIALTTKKTSLNCEPEVTVEFYSFPQQCQWGNLTLQLCHFSVTVSNKNVAVYVRTCVSSRRASCSRSWQSCHWIISSGCWQNVKHVELDQPTVFRQHTSSLVATSVHSQVITQPLSPALIKEVFWTPISTWWTEDLPQLQGSRCQRSKYCHEDMVLP